MCARTTHEGLDAVHTHTHAYIDSQHAHAYTGTGPFVNRSALKLVELDHAFSLLTPRTPGEVFTWVDVCGGPGGFRCVH